MTSNKIKNILWTVTFVLLCVSATFLAASYVYMMIEDSVADGGDELEYKLWTATPGGYRFDTVSDFAILPSKIFFKDAERGALLMNNESLVREYYNDLKQFISLAVTAENVTEFSKDSLPVMEATLRASSSVYIEFPTELPLSLYMYYIDGKIPTDLLTEDAGLTFVKSFFVVKGDSGGYSLAAVSDGKITVFPTITETDYPEILAQTAFEGAEMQAGSDFMSAEFTLSVSDYNVTPFAISITDDVYTTDILSNEKTDITDSKEAVDLTLELFGYNPDKVNTYKESKDTDVYVADFGLLKLSNEKIAFEASSGDGINIDDYTLTENEISVFDALRISDGFISSVKSFSNGFSGGSATVRLDSVIFKDGALSISYFYYFDNIRIQGARAADFTFSGGKMTGAELYSLNIESSLLRKMTERSGVLYELYGKSDRFSDTSHFELTYRRSDAGLSAEWLLY